MRLEGRRKFFKTGNDGRANTGRTTTLWRWELEHWEELGQNLNIMLTSIVYPLV